MRTVLIIIISTIIMSARTALIMVARHNDLLVCRQNHRGKRSARKGGVLAPVTINLSSFGARFGVSRSHLRRLLESAYADGLLAAPPKNGSAIMLSNHLVAAFLACMASELGNYRLWALRGRAKLEV